MTRNRRLVAIVALITFALTTGVRAGDEPDPQALAQQCIQHVAQVTETCVNINVYQATQCVQMINALQATGHDVMAHLVAASCTLDVLVRSRQCGAEIRQTTHQCVHALIALDAPGLATVVHNAGEQGVTAVHNSRNQAIAAIRMSLED